MKTGLQFCNNFNALRDEFPSTSIREVLRHEPLLHPLRLQNETIRQFKRPKYQQRVPAKQAPAWSEAIRGG